MITVVSGLPRSGTSLMMSILESSKMLLVSDGIKKPDIDNKRGYYEFEQVKQLQYGDTKWLEGLSGKVVKIISFLLPYLPSNYVFKVIFMERSLEEILRSQEIMLTRKDRKKILFERSKIEDKYKVHLKEIKAWIALQRNFSVIYISYNRLVDMDDNEYNRLNGFLNGGLDIDQSMAVIDRNLYNQRC